MQLIDPASQPALQQGMQGPTNLSAPDCMPHCNPSNLPTRLVQPAPSHRALCLAPPRCQALPPSTTPRACQLAPLLPLLHLPAAAAAAGPAPAACRTGRRVRSRRPTWCALHLLRHAGQLSWAGNSGPVHRLASSPFTPLIFPPQPAAHPCTAWPTLQGVPNPFTVGHFDELAPPALQARVCC